jgi:hypothetical protein
VFEDDFVLRMVRKLAQMVAAVLGAAAAGKHEEAEQALEEGYQAALGPHRPMLDLLDGASLASLLEGPEHVRALGQLCEAESQLRSQQGNLALAELRSKQAAALRSTAG